MESHSELSGHRGHQLWRHLPNPGPRLLPPSVHLDEVPRLWKEKEPMNGIVIGCDA